MYNKLFSESFENLHNAMADVKATARCFWTMLERGIIDKNEYPFLLSEEAKIKLSQDYCSKAYENLRYGKHKESDELYLKAAKLGNIEGMFKIGIHSSNKCDAIYWFEKIVQISKIKKVDWNYLESSIKDLIRLYDDYNNKSMVSYYQQLLQKETNRNINDIEKNAFNSESDFRKLFYSLLDGRNGFSKDTTRAYRMMEESINKGYQYRSLYMWYAEYLREKRDERYFHYLLESQIYFYDDKNLYAKRSRLIAEAYLDGFGVQQNIEKAKEYLEHDALRYNQEDKESILLLAKIYTGEYGIKYIDFNYLINKLKSLQPHSYSWRNNYVYALLGDAYIGKSWIYFFKARYYYKKYEHISNYNSKFRIKYCQYSCFISFFLCFLFGCYLGLIVSFGVYTIH